MKPAVAISHRVQIKNIVFATDFSDAASAALPFAGQIAKKFGANLFAVHARMPANYALPPTEVWPAVVSELEEARVELTRNLYNRYPSVESEVLIGEGSVSEVIETVADEKKADLIVLGTSGRRGIGKFILGSVAEEILRRATCPVLTVGPHLEMEPGKEAGFKRMIYATNFSESSPSTAAYAVALAEEYGAHLTLVHVIEHPKTGELVRPHELEWAAMERLRNLVPRDAELACEPKVIVLHGSAAEKILETAEKENADLLVLGVRDGKGVVRATHLAGAVVHQVVSHATCPVLTVRS